MAACGGAVAPGRVVSIVDDKGYVPEICRIQSPVDDSAGGDPVRDLWGGRELRFVREKHRCRGRFTTVVPGRRNQIEQAGGGRISDKDRRQHTDGSRSGGDALSIPDHGGTNEKPDLTGNGDVASSVHVRRGKAFFKLTTAKRTSRRIEGGCTAIRVDVGSDEGIRCQGLDRETPRENTTYP